MLEKSFWRRKFEHITSLFFYTGVPFAAEWSPSLSIQAVPWVGCRHVQPHCSRSLTSHPLRHLSHCTHGCHNTQDVDNSYLCSVSIRNSLHILSSRQQMTSLELLAHLLCEMISLLSVSARNDQSYLCVPTGIPAAPIWQHCEYIRVLFF